MLRKISILFLAFASFILSHGQDSTKTSTTTISGAVDVYYKYDFAKTKFNNYTSFTNSHNSFELGMANLKVEHTIGKIDMVADLAFGQREKEFSYNDDGITQAIKQLYVSYSPASWLKLTAGSWATHCSYEVADAWLNRNYSMSYMFSYGPFLHTGIKADVTTGKHSFMVGVANPTDYKFSQTDSKKFFIAQYVIAPSDGWKFFINYVGGQRPSDSAKTYYYEIVMSGKITDKFNIGYHLGTNNYKFQTNGKYGSSQAWWGTVLYLNYDPQSWFGLTLRGEYFNDDKQLLMFAAAPDGGNIFATTLSANFRIDNLTIIPELRIENASQQIFTNSSGAATKSAANVLLAAVYHF
jgi:hypothetical protein